MKSTCILLNTILMISTFSNSAAQAQSSLKEAYKDAFLIGTAVNEEIANGSDAASTKLVKQHFNSITAENVLKAESVNPQPGVYTFDAADEFVAFGEARNLFIVGHTLV